MTPSGLESQVRLRADNRCEYCRMHQSLQGATFHIEHVIPKSRGGETTLSNLAWACPGCNLRKSDRTEATDPRSGEVVPLFNPRNDDWADHFEWHGHELIARSSVAQVTIAALNLNHSRRLRIREAEQMFDLFPPS
ncbi:MAG: HNH endonuclease [Planctomycetota bacterium]|nr:HNH endonuclease [Planctomycetota bacterium]MDA0921389.1 HNH endonuclease [Planctomycetota bacterium]MDA1160503.1 HNH endonuclease [Planctomycetota bacterium]